MPQSFWIEEYRKKAALADPIAQTGRHPKFQAVEFLHVVREAIALLDLRREHDLLDVGCANGLFAIVLSACCRSILGIEPVEELVGLARKNLAHCRNVRVEVGHGAAIPAPSGSFDRALMLGAIQMVPPQEAREIFRELRRVMRTGGRLLIGPVPDARRRTSFLDPYLEGVRAATHLSEEQKKEIITRNHNAYWYDPSELDAWWSDLGCRTTVHPLPANDPDAKLRYNFVVSVQE